MAVSLVSCAIIAMGIVLLACIDGSSAVDQTHRQPSGDILTKFTLARPYIDSGMTIPHYHFNGHTVVTEDYVRLTPDRQSKRGGLWSREPLNSMMWEVTVQFRVSGVGKHLYGDGFAFWYTKDRLETGPVFGGRDHFVGLGVFFDTYSNEAHHNHGHPYISGLVGDGSIAYDHDRDGTHQQVAGCQSFFRNVDHDTYARFSYSRLEQKLQVFVDAKNEGSWDLCFETTDINLPEGYYIGFTAATGDLADNHDIIRVEVTEPSMADGEKKNILKVMATLSATPFAKHAELHREHIMEAVKQLTKRSWSDALLTYALYVLVLTAIGGGAFMYWKKQKKKKEEGRFAF